MALVVGMVRTLKSELEFNCQLQIPLESTIIARVIGHATTLLNLETVGLDGKVPFERWRLWTPHGQMRVRGASVDLDTGNKLQVSP